MESISSQYAAIPFVGLAVLVLIVVGTVARSVKQRRGITPGMIAWPLPFAALLAFVGTWCSIGLVSTSQPELVFISFTVGTVLLGATTLLRRRTFTRILDMGGKAAHLLRAGRDLALMLAASVLSVFALEFACNEDFAQIGASFIAFSVALVFVFMLVCYFLGQRTGVLAAIVVIACVVMGIAEHFVLEFKTAAILPNDLLALGTAAAVSGNYTYMLTDKIIAALLAGGTALCALSFIQPAPLRSFHSKATIGANIACNLGVAAALCMGCVQFFSTVKVEDLLDFTYDAWMPQTTYAQRGFIPAFCALAQDLPIPKPENYSDERADETLASYVERYEVIMGSQPSRKEAEAQFNEVKPAVIAVMNESFADLSIYQDLADLGYQGPQYFKSLSDTLQRGTVLSSVYGGGTANSEFEFLTSNSIAFVGSGKYPYQLYTFDDVNNLARQFDELGYRTTAIHPHAGSNWNRDRVFEQMGFDDFIENKDAFSTAPGYHSGATDRATYDKILELLREDDTPQFIFDITIQNHSGYDPSTIPAGDMLNYRLPGLSDEQNDQLNVYLACMERSDQDLAYFIEELSQLDRPVVLVFFGDHQPSASNPINYSGSCAQDDDFTRAWRSSETQYFIWANYDVAGNDQTGYNEELGMSTLGARLLHDIGAPLSDYQKAILAARETVPALNVNAFRASDGLYYSLESETPYDDTLNDLAVMQYRHFAEQVS